MALRFLESFDIYGESGATGTALSNALAMRWTSVSIGTTALLINGWTSGLAFDFVAANRYLRKTFDNQATWIIGFAFRQANLANNTRCLALYDGAESDTTRQISLFINGCGKLALTRRHDTILEVSSKALKENTWYYIELKATINNSGSVEVRVNGEPWISFSGDTQYTSNAYASRLEFFAPNITNAFFQLDDIYVADGTSGVNDFQGPTKIEALWPTGDTATLQWQVASGNHYDKIDERPQNDGTDYVYETTANDIDLYTYGNLSVIESNIFGVQMSTTAALSDAGSMTLKERWKAATEIDGASHTVDSTTYTTKVGIQETDTDSNSWTASTVNAGEYGIKVG